MKLNLTYDSDMIKQLIVDDIERKLGVEIPKNELKVLVKSKQNYREHQFEHGELKCELEVNI